MAHGPYTRLRIKSLKFISAVDAGAQGPISNVALIKRADDTDQFEAVCKVAGSLPEIGLVFGWALASTVDGGKTPHIDLQRDAVVSGDDLIKVAAAFMEAGGGSDVMHDDVPDGRVLFMFPLTDEVKAALTLKSDVEGIAIGMKPSAATFKRFVSGELKAFSIAGEGVRELVKAGPKCEACGAYGAADAKKCAGCGAVLKALWSTAYKDQLPDSAFLHVESGGKLEDGKTTPRVLRHFPVRDAGGKVDVVHLRAAIADIPKSSLPAATQEPLQIRAERMLAAQHDRARKRLAKQAVLTSAVDGHQHSIDLDDPADEWRDQCSTSHQVAAGADTGHCHAWTYDATTGEITIAEDSGHTHTVDVKVPADVLAAAVLQEAAESKRRACANATAAASAIADGTVGVSVTVIEARAPAAAISPPADDVSTVKSEPKEPTDMTTDANRIRDLESLNARLEKMNTLTDAQRAYFAKLKGGDADNYLNLTPNQREVVLVDLEKSDEVIYTATDGTKYRKSQPVEVINAAKATDAMNDQLAKLEKREKDLEFSKRGEALFVNILKGARGDIPMRLMRAIETEFVKADERDEVIKAMKQYEAAFVELTKTKGYAPSENQGEQTPQAKLDHLAAEYAKQHNVPIHKAAAAVLATPAGEALYAQLPTARA